MPRKPPPGPMQDNLFDKIKELASIRDKPGEFNQGLKIFLTPKEAADYLQIDPRRINLMLMDGLLPNRGDLFSPYIHIDDLAKFKNKM
jgi:hypothetical protein